MGNNIVVTNEHQLHQALSSDTNFSFQQSFHSLNLSRPSQSPLSHAKPEDLYRIVEAITTSGLKELKINNFPKGVTYCLYQIIEMLKKNPPLEILSLCNCELNPLQMAEILSALKENRNLTTLRMSSNNVGLVGCKSLCEMLSLNTTLRTLDLSSNILGFEECLLLATGLSQNSTLAYLVLNNCQLKPDSVSLIIKTIKSSTMLRAVGIGGSQIGMEEWRDIKSWLQMNTTLEILCLNDTSLDINSCACLAAGLEQNKNLKMLFLKQNNNLGVQGCAEISRVLSSHPSLAELYLAHCCLDDSACYHIADMVKKSTSLVSLDLQDNEISEIGLNYIKEAIMLNTSLTFLHFPNEISIGGEQTADVSKIKETLKKINGRTL